MHDRNTWKVLTGNVYAFFTFHHFVLISAFQDENHLLRIFCIYVEHFIIQKLNRVFASIVNVFGHLSFKSRLNYEFW